MSPGENLGCPAPLHPTSEAAGHPALTEAIANGGTPHSCCRQASLRRSYHIPHCMSAQQQCGQPSLPRQVTSQVSCPNTSASASGAVGKSGRRPPQPSNQSNVAAVPLREVWRAGSNEFAFATQNQPQRNARTCHHTWWPYSRHHRTQWTWCPHCSRWTYVTRRNAGAVVARGLGVCPPVADVHWLC